MYLPGSTTLYLNLSLLSETGAWDRPPISAFTLRLARRKQRSSRTRPVRAALSTLFA
jgi:hypothetical protein